MQWYYAQNNEKIGPVTEDQLIELVGVGTLGPMSLIWNEDYDNWIVLEEVFEFGDGEAVEEEAFEEVIEEEIVEEVEEEVEWFYAFSGGEQEGPCTFESLGVAWKDGTIEGDTLVWTQGLGSWQPISRVTAFSGYAPPIQLKAKPKKKTSAGKQIRINRGGAATPVKTTSSYSSSSSFSSSDIYASPESDPRRGLEDGEEGWEDKGLKWLFLSLEGRIPRGLWWMSILYSIPIVIVIGAIYGTLFWVNMYLAAAAYIPLAILTIYSSVCLNGKRWHDRGKSAWWICIGFVPFVGGLYAFIVCGFLRGEEGLNAYGHDPLAQP